MTLITLSWFSSDDLIFLDGQHLILGEVKYIILRIWLHVWFHKYMQNIHIYT